jgi:S-formylglutathione hydrolase FrmB
MPLFQCSFFSDALQIQTEMNVLLPAAPIDTPGGKHKTMLLLHGISDDHTAWCRQTSIERYADFCQMAIVMPTAHRSFYADMAIGYKYWTHISDEVPRLARRWFPLSDEPRHNHVAGLSMGGYGAFKLALNHPDRYATAASLSGVLDLAQRAGPGSDGAFAADLQRAFGDPPRIAGTDADLFHVSQRLAASGRPAPRLYACCGTADARYDANRRFQKHCEQLGIPVDWEFHDGRDHDWGYWDQQIQRVFQWLRRRG